MSKSLKNFTTIREALNKGDWTPRGLRIVFLLGAWKDGLEITGDLVKAGVAWEERVNNFFIKVRDIQTRHTTNGSMNGHDDELSKTIEGAKSRFHDALCDSFDTPTAMRTIAELLTAYNSAKNVPEDISISMGQWLTDMVVMLGLDATPQTDKLGWSGLDVPSEVLPFVQPLAELRDAIRASYSRYSRQFCDHSTAAEEGLIEC